MIKNEKIRRGVLKLLNCNSLRYFGLLVYNFEFIEADPSFCPTFMVGLVGTAPRQRWNIWYNSDFADSCTIGENIYVTIHEIIHAISGHCFRKAGRQDEFWSISTDHIININIDRDINSNSLKELEKPKDRFIIEEISAHYDWTAEMVYEWLQENAEIVSLGSEKFVVGIPSGMSQSSKDGEGDGEGEGGGGDGAATITIEQKGVRIKSTGRIYPISMDMKMSDGADSQAAQSIAAQARAHANADRTRGLISGNLRHLLKNIIDIQIPPERILENAIRAQLQKGEERSWRIPNKRLMAHGIVIPSIDMELQLSEVIFLNDHSGSISEKEIMMFSGVMKNCAQLFTKLHIIKHDYIILRDGGVTVLDRDELLTSKVLFEAVGRGGTSHKEPFQYVQKEFEKGTTISLVIGLTDWASDIQIIWSNFTFHQHIPIIWVVPYHVTVDPRYGKVLPIIDGRRIK